MFWLIFSIITCLKFLLIQFYRSTDFEVHRNWLAITHSLPLSKWYFESTSEWTLDYPPMFAYFEWILSQFAKYVDPQMLVIKNLNYSSMETIYFQRLSVIVTDLIYAFGVRSCINAIITMEPADHPEQRQQQKQPHQQSLRLDKIILSGLLLTNIGLFFIDHIHFQYNGILFGILLLSIAGILREQYLKSSIYFMILLNMKHIFIYVSPAYGIFLLKFYCFRSMRRDFIFSIIKLIVIVIGILLLSFGPFYDHLPQVLSRLFPFKRGLCHAYWAPNFWALYNVGDKLLVATIGGVNARNITSNTGGLVQEFNHIVLPNIKPIYTFIITAIAMIPCLLKLLFIKYNRSRTPQYFIRAVTICACTSFLFGWHVHEKAILMVLIPLSLLSTVSSTDASMTIFLSTIGNYSLFPLLFKPELALIKISLFLVYTNLSIIGLKQRHGNRLSFPFYEKFYLFGLIIPFLYEFVFQYSLNFDKRYPFLPLLLISVYCSLGVTYFWLKYYLIFLLSTNLNAKTNHNNNNNNIKNKNNRNRVKTKQKTKLS